MFKINARALSRPHLPVRVARQRQESERGTGQTGGGFQIRIGARAGVPLGRVCSVQTLVYGYYRTACGVLPVRNDDGMRLYETSGLDERSDLSQRYSTLYIVFIKNFLSYFSSPSLSVSPAQ